MQKTLVYNTLCSLANHPTADGVYEALHDKYPSVSRATVYRVLNRLAEKGEILKVEITNGADHFDHRTMPHYHIFCESCGKVCDVDMPEMSGLEKSVRSCSGYKVKGYTILFSGICPDCAAAEDN